MVHVVRVLNVFYVEHETILPWAIISTWATISINIVPEFSVNKPRAYFREMTIFGENILPKISPWAYLRKVLNFA